MNMEIQIDIRHCLKTLLRKFWIVVIITMIIFVGTFIITYREGKNIYYAETTVYSIANGNYQKAVEGVSLMMTYKSIITSLQVSTKAATALTNMGINGKDIQNMISADCSTDSTVLYIRAKADDPKMAVNVSNAVAQAFVAQVNEIAGNDNVQVLDAADRYKEYYDAKKAQLKIRLVVVALSILVTSFLICLCEVFSTKVHSVYDCSLGGELDIIGIIPTYEKV